jgi:hypothetical protein
VQDKKTDARVLWIQLYYVAAHPPISCKAKHV